MENDDDLFSSFNVNFELDPELEAELNAALAKIDEEEQFRSQQRSPHIPEYMPSLPEPPTEIDAMDINEVPSHFQQRHAVSNAKRTAEEESIEGERPRKRPRVDAPQLSEPPPAIEEMDVDQYNEEMDLYPQLNVAHRATLNGMHITLNEDIAMSFHDLLRFLRIRGYITEHGTLLTKTTNKFKTQWFQMAAEFATKWTVESIAEFSNELKSFIEILIESLNQGRFYDASGASQKCTSLRDFVMLFSSMGGRYSNQPVIKTTQMISLIMTLVSGFMVWSPENEQLIYEGLSDRYYQINSLHDWGIVSPIRDWTRDGTSLGFFANPRMWFYMYPFDSHQNQVHNALLMNLLDQTSPEHVYNNPAPPTTIRGVVSNTDPLMSPLFIHQTRQEKLVELMEALIIGYHMEKASNIYRVPGARWDSLLHHQMFHLERKTFDVGFDPEFPSKPISEWIRSHRTAGESGILTDPTRETIITTYHNGYILQDFLNHIKAKFMNKSETYVYTFKDDSSVPPVAKMNHVFNQLIQCLVRESHPLIKDQLPNNPVFSQDYIDGRNRFDRMEMHRFGQLFTDTLFTVFLLTDYVNERLTDDEILQNQPILSKEDPDFVNLIETIEWNILENMIERHMHFLAQFIPNLKNRLLLPQFYSDPTNPMDVVIKGFGLYDQLDSVNMANLDKTVAYPHWKLNPLLAGILPNQPLNELGYNALNFMQEAKENNDLVQQHMERSVNNKYPFITAGFGSMLFLDSRKEFGLYHAVRLVDQFYNWIQYRNLICQHPKLIIDHTIFGTTGQIITKPVSILLPRFNFPYTPAMTHGQMIDTKLIYRNVFTESAELSHISHKEISTVLACATLINKLLILSNGLRFNMISGQSKNFARSKPNLMLSLYNPMGQTSVQETPEKLANIEQMITNGIYDPDTSKSMKILENIPKNSVNLVELFSTDNPNGINRHMVAVLKDLMSQIQLTHNPIPYLPLTSTHKNARMSIKWNETEKKFILSRGKDPKPYGDSVMDTFNLEGKMTALIAGQVYRSFMELQLSNLFTSAYWTTYLSGFRFVRVKRANRELIDQIPTVLNNNERLVNSRQETIKSITDLLNNELNDALYHVFDTTAIVSAIQEILKTLDNPKFNPLFESLRNDDDRGIIIQELRDFLYWLQTFDANYSKLKFYKEVPEIERTDPYLLKKCLDCLLRCKMGMHKRPHIYGPLFAELRNIIGAASDIMAHLNQTYYHVFYHTVFNNMNGEPLKSAAEQYLENTIRNLLSVIPINLADPNNNITNPTQPLKKTYNDQIDSLLSFMTSRLVPVDGKIDGMAEYRTMGAKYFISKKDAVSLPVSDGIRILIHLLKNTIDQWIQTFKQAILDQPLYQIPVLSSIQTLDDWKERLWLDGGDANLKTANAMMIPFQVPNSPIKNGTYQNMDSLSNDALVQAAYKILGPVSQFDDSKPIGDNMLRYFDLCLDTDRGVMLPWTHEYRYFMGGTIVELTPLNTSLEAKGTVDTRFIHVPYFGLVDSINQAYSQPQNQIATSSQHRMSSVEPFMHFMQGQSIDNVHKIFVTKTQVKELKKEQKGKEKEVDSLVIDETNKFYTPTITGHNGMSQLLQIYAIAKKARKNIKAYLDWLCGLLTLENSVILPGELELLPTGPQTREDKLNADRQSLKSIIGEDTLTNWDTAIQNMKDILYTYVNTLGMNVVDQTAIPTLAPNMAGRTEITSKSSKSLLFGATSSAQDVEHQQAANVQPTIGTNNDQNANILNSLNQPPTDQEMEDWLGK